MDATENPSQTAVANGRALLERTGRHFLILTFVTTLPDGTQHLETRSTFVVDMVGTWVLVTAGHVIHSLRTVYPRRGWTASDFRLHDNLAGSRFPGPPGVMFDFRPDECLAVNEDWGDFGLVALHPIAIEALRAGGVAPIEDTAWSTGPLDAYASLLLTGVPTESVQVGLREITMRHTIVPLKLKNAPDEASLMYQAAMVQNEDDREHLRDIDGMSGGPIYGVKMIDGQARYFVVGVQSGWFKDSRILTFSAAAPFLHRLQQFIRDRAEAA